MSEEEKPLGRAKEGGDQDPTEDPELPTKGQMIAGVIGELQRHFRALNRSVRKAMDSAQGKNQGDGDERGT
jgi:hypothetical protein